MVVICSLTEADFPLVIDLAYRVWPQAYADVLTPAQIANILASIYSPHNLRAEYAAGHRFWAAYDGAVALGFASGYRDGAAVWIKKLYVLPEAQRRGVGRMLMATVVDAFAPAAEIHLLVNNGNLAAQAAYARLGFTKAAEVPVKMGDYAFTDFLFVKPL